MLLKPGMLKLIGGITAGVVAPTAIIGGYFLIGSSDKYRGFYTNPLSDAQSAMVEAYRGAVLQGAEMLITPGFNHATPIDIAFEGSDFFDKTGVVLLDSKTEKDSKASFNTANISYRTDLGSIQVGIAAAYFLNYYSDIFKSNGPNDSTLTYGMWGGLPFPSVTSFMGGFAAGIEWANTNLFGKKINGETYEKVYRLGDDKTPKVKYPDLTNGFGPSDGQASMRQIITGYPDILMPVAGPQIWTANDIISSVESKTVLVGVDSAVEDDPKNPEYKFKDKDGKQVGNGKRVQFSSLKNLARSLENVLNIVNNGNTWPHSTIPDDARRYTNFVDKTSRIGGFGTVSVGDSTNGCVGVSDEGKIFFDKALEASGNPDVDPSVDPKYDISTNMEYVGYSGKFGYDALDKEFAHNTSNSANVLNKKGFVQDTAGIAKKFKIILSSANSILMDSSFSQSCYLGLFNYLKSQGIDIPPIVNPGDKK